MSYPLIVQPSPLQQLADLLQGIRQRGMEQRMQREEIQRRALYLTLAQREQALSEQRAVQGETRWQQEFARQQAADAADAARQQRRDLLEQRRADRTEARARRAEIVAMLPENVTITDPQVLARLANEPLLARKQLSTTSPDVQAANAAMRQAERPDLGALIQGAQRESRPGISPRAGTHGGVTYSPDPYGVSVSLGGAGSGQRPAPGAVRAGALTMWRAYLERQDALSRDPAADMIPGGALFGRAVSEARIPFTGARPGREVGTALVNRALSPEAQRYQRASLIIQHAYPALLPHARMGTQMIEMMGEVTKTQPGQTDPTVRQQNEALMGEILRDFYTEIMGEEPPASLAEMDQRGGGAPGRTATGRSVTVPGAGTGAPPTPMILPRYRSRP